MSSDIRWKPCLNGIFAVSEHGEVVRVVFKKLYLKSRTLKPQLDHKGYLRIVAHVDGKRVNKLVHSIVAEAFIGPRPEGKQINHIDGNKRNPHFLNLEYVTPEENVRHAQKNRLYRHGEMATGGKLKDKDVLRIREIGRTVPTRVTAKLYGVSKEAINQILSGRTWKYLAAYDQEKKP